MVSICENILQVTKTKLQTPEVSYGHTFNEYLFYFNNSLLYTFVITALEGLKYSCIML